MTGLIVALPPVSNFPGGALTYAFHASALLDSPIYAPGGLAREFCPSHLKVNSFPYISNATKYGYSLITTFGKDSEKYLSSLPKPIIAVIHDGHTLYEFGGKEWTKNIDGFLVDVEPTKKQIMEFVKNASMLRIPIPYKKKEFNIDKNDNRENAIISLGRIVPERGHRLVATLSSFGYKVYVVGQEVRHDEYGLYYAKVCASGAEVISTPSDEEKNEIISRVKVAMSFPFTYEIDEPIEFNNLECMNMGVYPIVPNWQNKYFVEGGFCFAAVECPADAVKYVENVFHVDSFYKGARQINYIKLDDYSNMFKDRFVKFVNDVKNRPTCSSCGEKIPVGCMYCGICGKK